jgi:RNA polymerase sigma-70 factor, ECF subfamily
MDAAARAAEAVARLSYGKLVAILAARDRDVAAAEDALSEALARALARWPRTGPPARPEAWLLTVARRAAVDRSRAAATAARARPHLALLADERGLSGDGAFPDVRLGLMFVCAHPAIDAAARTPLMLQTVLGLDARRIASAFLTPPATLGQRLARAKARIRDAGLRFEPPSPEALVERAGPVLDAIYAAYTLGWDGGPAGDARATGLTEEAIWLGRVAADLMPEAPEAQGLVALMLYAEARAPARRDPATGGFVPLAEQDPARWSAPMIAEAEARLRRAAGQGAPGRFQIEAAIQAVHADRRRSGRTDWPSVVVLHRGLAMLAPSFGADVAAAAALGEARGPAAGLAALDALPGPRAATYQPYWATRAHLLARAGRPAEAALAYERAAGLSEDPAVRAWLLARRATQVGARGASTA